MAIARPRDRVTGRELAGIRGEMGVDAEDLAVTLGISASKLRTLEGSSDPIPFGASKRLRWLHDDWQRAQALEASGLPACDWASEWLQAHVGLTEVDAITESLKASEVHTSGCELCRARVQYLDDRFPPQRPFPGGGMAGFLGTLGSFFLVLPRWCRPAVAGAAILLVLTLPRVLFALISGPDRLAALGAGLQAAMAALLGGAVGGFAYSFVGAPIRRIGRLGDYLAGVVCVAAYLGALAVIAEPAFGEAILDFTDPISWIVFGFCSVLFGLLVGHWWFKDFDR